MADTFPRQYARTQRLTLGEPRNISVSPDGARVVFVRSRDGNDRTNCLWVLDATTGVEQLIADPIALMGVADDEHLPAEERARRERAREGAGGVVSYATDRSVTAAAFTLGGRLFLAGLLSGACRELPVVGPVFDARPDGSGRRLAYVQGRALRIAELDGTSRDLVSDDDPNISWGTAEFIAAEEMDRGKGYWWSPSGEQLAVCRVDVTPVDRWWIADPAQPSTPPTEHCYPAAGTANAKVELFVVGLDGALTAMVWDASAFPYLAQVAWASPSQLLLTVQSRDQKDLVILSADPDSGTTTELWRDSDPEWVELVGGSLGVLQDTRLVTCADRDGARRLMVGGEAVTPGDLQVRSIVHIGSETVVFSGNPIESPETLHVYRWSSDGVQQLTEGRSVNSASVGGDVVVIRRAALDSDLATFSIVGGPEIASYRELPLVSAAPTLVRLGERRLPAAVLFPTGHVPGTPLPVLLDPYGGPHAQRVTASRAGHATSQWFADQGFAVVVIDGRGTPGLGSRWEREVYGDLATPVLDDQVDGLHAAAELYRDLDLTRVGIRGWSFGGYLAALAVLRRPDVFHAAIAGAPVTDWRLYDTHYTERYLGNPMVDPGPYERTSLIADAHRLERPLLLIHGLADDNVVAAHTLQLSSALLAAGRPHQVLPLSGVTHMTPQDVVAENNLLLQLGFLRSALGLPAGLNRLSSTG